MRVCARVCACVFVGACEPASACVCLCVRACVRLLARLYETSYIPKLEEAQPHEFLRNGDRLLTQAAIFSSRPKMCVCLWYRSTLCFCTKHNERQLGSKVFICNKLDVSKHPCSTLQHVMLNAAAMYRPVQCPAVNTQYYMIYYYISL